MENTRVVCINLRSRPERWAQFCDTIRGHQIAPTGEVQRHFARTPADVLRPSWWQEGQHRQREGWYACRESHLDVWRSAIRDGVSHLLVFEDDAVLATDFDDAYRRMLAELPDDWFGYWLGGDVRAVRAYYRPNCHRLRRTLMTHAYGLSVHGLRRAYDHVMYWQAETIDVALCALFDSFQPGAFYCPPSWIVSQSDGYSDCEQAFVERQKDT